MNIQDILRKGGGKLGVKIDNSENYDLELVENIIGKVDATLDYSELYDFQLVEMELGKIDMVLDFSEFYDYTLGDSADDYVHRDVVIAQTTYLVTEDNYIITTHDNYNIQYH
jgi:hypothetical protein